MKSKPRRWYFKAIWYLKSFHLCYILPRDETEYFELHCLLGIYLWFPTKNLQKKLTCFVFNKGCKKHVILLWLDIYWEAWKKQEINSFFHVCFIDTLARQTSFWGIVKYLSLLFECFIVFSQEGTSIVLLKHNKWGILPLMGYFDTWQPERETDAVKLK